MVIKQRCYSENSRDYPLYGARGIRMAAVWSPDNNLGRTNFYKWLDDSLKELGLNSLEGVEIGRRDRDGDYSPENCILRTRLETQQQKRDVILTRNCVIKARRLARQRHDLSITDIAKKYKCSKEAMRSALRGRTWKSLNHIEPPLSVNWNGKNPRFN